MVKTYTHTKKNTTSKRIYDVQHTTLTKLTERQHPK